MVVGATITMANTTEQRTMPWWTTGFCLERLLMQSSSVTNDFVDLDQLVFQLVAKAAVLAICSSAALVASA